MKNMNNMSESVLKAVNGGQQIIGVHTPLGDFDAEVLIEMFLENPAQAKGYVALAKSMCPGLVDEFMNECGEKGLTVPEGLLNLLGVEH